MNHLHFSSHRKKITEYVAVLYQTDILKRLSMKGMFTSQYLAVQSYCQVQHEFPRYPRTPTEHLQNHCLQNNGELNREIIKDL